MEENTSISEDMREAEELHLLCTHSADPTATRAESSSWAEVLPHHPQGPRQDHVRLNESNRTTGRLVRWSSVIVRKTPSCAST